MEYAGSEAGGFKIKQKSAGVPDRISHSDFFGRAQDPPLRLRGSAWRFQLTCMKQNNFGVATEMKAKKRFLLCFSLGFSPLASPKVGCTYSYNKIVDIASRLGKGRPR